jgi:hypothetical protein
LEDFSVKGYMVMILGIASAVAVVSLISASAVALWGVVLWVAGVEKKLPAAMPVKNGGGL